jgi:hypothetical protein
MTRVAAATAIDQVSLPDPPEGLATLAEAYASVAWERV